MSEQSNEQKRKFRVYLDEAKERQTTHWDWDCMTTAEIDALMQANRSQSSTPARRASVPGGFWLKTVGATVAVLASVGVLLGLSGVIGG